MSADLAIAIKVGASVGAALGSLRSLVSGTRDLTRSTTLLQKEYNLLDRAISRATRNGSANLQRLTELANLTGKMQTNQRSQMMVETRLEAGKQSREAIRSQVMGVVASLGIISVPIKGGNGL